MKNIWWFDAVNELVLVGSVLINIYLWFKSKTDKRFELIANHASDANERLLNAVSERKADVAGLDKRVSLIESRLETIPTHDDLNDIRKTVTDISGTVARIEERSNFTIDSMRRIERHLLDSP